MLARDAGGSWRSARLLEEGMADLRTNEALLRALRKASEIRPTAEELHRQRVSFIMGIVKDDSGITRARVEQVLANQEGEKSS